MSDRTRAEIVRGLFAAYLANDREAVEGALTAGFSFHQPV